MKRLIVVVAAALMLAGCGKEEKSVPQIGTNMVVQTYADLPQEAVLATVNGKGLTKLDVETDLALQTSLLRIAMPNIKGERIRREQTRLVRKSVENFIRRRVMTDEAVHRGIVATAGEIESVRTNFAAKAFRGKKLSYADLCKKLTPAMARKLDADLAADASVFKLEKELAKETAFMPTDADVANRLVKFAEYNKRAQAIEAKTWQAATNAWQGITAGEPFERAAERLKSKDDHVTYEPEWGSFELGFFNDCPTLQSCLKVMKPGMVAPPVEADNGVVLVKLVEIVEPKRPTDSVRYSLSQIRFALPEYYASYTAESLKDALIKEVSEQRLNEKVSRLIKQADIQYPNGPTKKLFKKITKEN